ncbi:MAG: hypothetical protein HQ518_04030 [Rhodopirellula sp.]|nr:hypothetical protein [Rhodopirellula sp.]
MLKSLEARVQDGKVEFLEPIPASLHGRVIVTFLEEQVPIDLAERGIDEQQAGDLRHRLQAFAPDWDRPEMDVYDEE